MIPDVVENSLQLPRVASVLKKVGGGILVDVAVEVWPQRISKDRKFVLNYEQIGVYAKFYPFFFITLRLPVEL